MTLAIDNSMALAWSFLDERTPRIMAVLDRVETGGAFAPSLWPLEALNGLATAQRRGRIDGAMRQALADRLEALPIELDAETMTQAWGTTARLAAHHRLSVYDATYLELALRRRLPLATLDRPLRAAAESLGLELLGL